MRAFALVLAICGCASQKHNVATMDIHPVDGSGGRTLEWENGVLSVLGRNGKLFIIRPDPHSGPGCAAGLISNVNVGGGGGGAGTTTVTSIRVNVCPTGQEGAWTRWHANVHQSVGGSQLRDLPPTFEFATSSPSESTLAIGAGGGHLEVSVPAGSFGWALLQHPEFLATIVVIGLVPRSSNGHYEISR